MGYGYYEINGKPCGYAVDAVCEHPGCETQIDRGLAYACGGDPYEGDGSCAGHFCERHLSIHKDPDTDVHHGYCQERSKQWSGYPACGDDDPSQCAVCHGEEEVFDPDHYDNLAAGPNEPVAR